MASGLCGTDAPNAVSAMALAAGCSDGDFSQTWDFSTSSRMPLRVAALSVLKSEVIGWNNS
jgi:hypothetical protein